MNDCVFCKIVKKETPKEFVYEDEQIVAFNDLYPKKPTHLLVIPKEHIADFFDMQDEKTHLAITKGLQHLVEKTGLNQKGYKIEVNGGGYQDIFHLHFHLTGPQKYEIQE